MRSQDPSDPEHSVMTGCGRRTCKRKPMAGWLARDQRILCGANDYMIHFFQISSMSLVICHLLLVYARAHHWIIKWPPLSIEWQMHRVPLLGLLYRLVIGVAISGSVTVVGDEFNRALRSSSAPKRGGEERRCVIEREDGLDRGPKPIVCGRGLRPRP